jgi:ribosomal protein S18 acetylase RimI-like enzyme
MDRLAIQFAEPEDATEIVTLIGSSFRQEFLQLMIYGCRGASEYIRMQLGSTGLFADSIYFVARANGRTVGAAEFRRQADRLFLNYIVVAPGCRGQHVGAKLFWEAIRMSGWTAGQIELDVLQDNTSALRWYRRLGFDATRSTEFIELAPPPEPGGHPAYLTGLPQARVCQERFGFSAFHVATAAGTFSAGRIGDGWFRLTDVKAVRSRSVFAALNLLDPRRRIFAMVPASSVSAEQTVQVLATTHRMTAEIHKVMDSLSHD